MSQLRGHQMARDLLIQSFDQGNCSVYLLVGPPHVGKGLMARIVAASIHGISELDKPHIDTLIFDEVLKANSDEGEKRWKKSVGSLTRFISLSPAQSHTKVAIVEDIDRLSLQAANALLKTLEEPARNAVIILTAGEIDAVLPTIQSRARIIRLNYLTDDEVREYVVGRTSEQIDEIVLLANGAFGVAKHLLDNPEFFKAQIGHLESFRTVLGGQITDGLQIANIKDRDRAIEMLTVWLNLARRLLVIAVSSRSNAVLQSLVGLYDTRQLTRLISQLRDVLNSLRTGANVRIALESLVLSWTGQATQIA